MAEEPFVSPQGWRAKELSAKLREMTAMANRNVDAQLSAFSRIRGLKIDLADMAENDPNREATELALMEAEEQLAALQRDAPSPAVEPAEPPKPVDPVQTPPNQGEGEGDGGSGDDSGQA